MRSGTLVITVCLLACGGADVAAPPPAKSATPSPRSEPSPSPSPRDRSLGSVVGDAVDDARKADLDPRFLGKWRIEQWGVSYELRMVEGRLVVTGEDYVNDEAFEVSDVRWEPPVLHATFRMPSTNHTTRSQLRVIDQDHLEDAYTGAAAGVDVWERLP